MSDDEARAGETPEKEPPPTGLGILFLAAVLALALVLSLVALVAYMAFSPPKTVNPPSHQAPMKAAPEGRLPGLGGTSDRRT
jgi:hypothetical protein